MLLALAGGLAAPGPGVALSRHVGSLMAIVLFLMALTLPGGRLRRAVRSGRSILACFAVSYLVLPLLGGIAVATCFPGEAGLLVLGALPCTLASAVVWTRLARGNDAVAMVFTTLSNALTFLLAPAILWIGLSRWLPLDTGEMAGKLLTRVLLPVLAGQVARGLLPRLAEWAAPAVSFLCRLLVLVIVLVGVSRAAGFLGASPGKATALVLTAAAIHGAALLAAAAVSRVLRIAPGDARGVLFAGTQKSLYVGVYLAAEFFPDHPSALVPLLAYHVVQLVLDTPLADHLARKGLVREKPQGVGEKRPHPPSC